MIGSIVLSLHSTLSESRAEILRSLKLRAPFIFVYPDGVSVHTNQESYVLLKHFRGSLWLRIVSHGIPRRLTLLHSPISTFRHTSTATALLSPRTSHVSYDLSIHQERASVHAKVRSIANRSARQIQCAVRLFLATHHVEVMRRRVHACVLIQSHIRKFTSTKMVANRRKQARSASNIQALVRGKQVRARTQREARLVTRIQSYERMRQVNARFQVLRSEHKAAFIVQRIYRGYRIRTSVSGFVLVCASITRIDFCR